MIKFFSYHHQRSGNSYSICFDEEGMEKMVLVLSRALNTYHDPELTELLDSLKAIDAAIAAGGNLTSNTERRK